MDEIIDQGVTGCIVESIDDAVAAVGEAAKLDRNLVREAFEKRFSAMRMARDYVTIYEQLLDTASSTHRIAAAV